MLELVIVMLNFAVAALQLINWFHKALGPDTDPVKHQSL